MKRSKFSLSHYRLMTCNMGQLVPTSCVEVLPGDAFQQNSTAFIRVSPLLAPVMHPVKVQLHHWYVPSRIVWDGWEDFITGGPDGFDNAVFPTITMNETNNTVGSLADYLGLPQPGTGETYEVSALPFRMYAKIFNEWYRDQDLVTPLDISLEDGPDTTTSTDLQNRAWERDYFTQSRPWTQKGPEVSIPLTGDAPVQGIAAADQAYTSGTVYETGGSAGSPENVNVSPRLIEDPSNTGFPGVFADLSGVSAATIGELRTAFALQRYEEARARYGSRYTEYLRYLGVKSSDARLQNPEYLGGGSSTLQFSEVLATAEGTDTVVGDMKGHGISAARSNRYRRYFEEHGYVMTFMSVMPKTMYVQGIPRTWLRRTKEDFWQTELQHIGQQEIQNQELYHNAADPTGVFGYANRYEEYRGEINNIAGEFRTTELDFWHMARIFSTEPALNSEFVTSNPTKRINAVQTNDQLWCMLNHSIQARRLVAKSANSFIF